MRDRLTASTWWMGIFLGLGSLLLTVSVALASGGGEAAHGAAPGGHGITPEKIQDFIWRTLNFVVFAAILIKLTAKPAKAFFSQRSTDIGESFEELETKKAAQELKQEVAEKATQMAEALIQKEITSTDQTQLVEEYLNKVVEKH